MVIWSSNSFLGLMRVVVCKGQLVEGEVIGVVGCSVHYSLFCLVAVMALFGR
jgi:hypothetical protein